MKESELKVAVFAAKLISGFMTLTILTIVQSQVEIYGYMGFSVIAAFFCLVIGAYVVGADKLELHGSFFKSIVVLHIGTAIVAVCALLESLIPKAGHVFGVGILLLHLMLVIEGRRVRRTESNSAD